PPDGHARGSGGGQPREHGPPHTVDVAEGQGREQAESHAHRAGGDEHARGGRAGRPPRPTPPRGGRPSDRAAPRRAGHPQPPSAAALGGKVPLKQAPRGAPSKGGAVFLPTKEVFLLDLKKDDSSPAAVASRSEALIQSIPPGSRLPPYRELQQRSRLSPATV